jgi:hypothetical protein
MAGTGGTSSSTKPVELWTFLGFAVGKREEDSTWLFRRLFVFTRRELRVGFGTAGRAATGRREKSGVFRAEEGVEVLRANAAGDWAVWRTLETRSG